MAQMQGADADRDADQDQDQDATSTDDADEDAEEYADTDGGANVQGSFADRTKDQGIAQGFGHYRDWLASINRFELTRGWPAYITASNTFNPDVGSAPSENYTEGWLSAALASVASEPQIKSLCWFVDGIPGDTQWLDFQLTEPRGNLRLAAEEFDRLLREAKE